MGSICSVQDAEGGDKALICYADEQASKPSPSNFWEVLKKWQCIWMWENLQWVGVDDWLAAAIDEGACVAVTDGLNMSDLYLNINLLSYNAPKEGEGYGANSQRFLV
jgi:hypothetical protein